MDSNFSGSIAKLRGASDDEISMGQRGDLMKPNSSEAKTKVSSITDHTDLVLEEPDRLGKKPGKDIAHPAEPDISAAAASLNPKLAALSLGNKGKRLCSGPKGRISRRRNRKDRGASIGLGRLLEYQTKTIKKCLQLLLLLLSSPKEEDVRSVVMTTSTFVAHTWSVFHLVQLLALTIL